MPTTATPHPSFGNYTSADINRPSPLAIDVTPSDTDELTYYCRWLRVGTTAGAVTVVTVEGNTVLIDGVQLGERIDLLHKQVKATGTAAVGITSFV